MAGKRKTREASCETRRDPGFLEALSALEAASVLTSLVARHPELRSEVEAIAREALNGDSFLEIADDVEAAVLQYGYDDLNGRAGGHSWGYVEPTEAAWELLEEAVQPFIDDMTRYLSAGLEEPARRSCQGVLLGLYRARGGGGNDILGWAPDFPSEESDYVLDIWSKGGEAEKTVQRRLSRDFVCEHIPEWEWAAQSKEGPQ